MPEYYLDIVGGGPRLKIKDSPFLPRVGEIIYRNSVEYRVKEVIHCADDPERRQPQELLPLIIAELAEK